MSDLMPDTIPEVESACKRIPISAAKRISVDYNFPEVIIFAYDPVSGDQHVTTYGRTLEQCKDAAKAGNYLKKALGWPEKLCNTQPARAKRQKLEVTKGE
jgi:hypothetical protein